MTITLHYLNKSRATRVVWLLEELGIDYQTKVYFRNKKTMLAPPELAKVHPSGSSPLIEDDGQVYAESGLILEHLVTTYGKNTSLIWKDAKEEATIKYALYSAESNVMISGMMLGVHHVAVQRAPWGVSRLVKGLFGLIDSQYAGPQFEKQLSNLSNQIEANNGYYCNGRLTVADIMYWVSLEQFLNFGLLPNLEQRYPVIGQWFKRLEAETKYTQAKNKEKQLESNSKL